jgi:hypothetical protein
LVQTQCGGNYTLGQTLNIIPYPGFPNYRVKIEEGSGEDVVLVQERVIPYSYFKLNEFSLAQLNKNYFISVEIVLPGSTPGANYGSPCEINTGTPPITKTVVPFKAIAYPNPFANNFMLDVKTTNQSVVNVKVYDMVGRLIEQREVNVSDMETTTIGNNYPSGVYNVVVAQEDNLQTVRVVKR